MIFVTVGTQKQSFNRIFDWVAQIKPAQRVVFQTGYTNLNETPYEAYAFPENYKDLLNEADIIICHGGVGSIIEAISLKKKVIAIPRLAKYDEHVDNHQTEIVKKMVADNLIFTADSSSELNEKLMAINEHKFKIYKSNNRVFNDNLSTLIDRMDKNE